MYTEMITKTRNSFTLHHYLELADQLKVLEEANEKLTSTNTFKEKLLAILAHDIHSPLNSIKSFLSLVQNEQVPHDEQQSIQKNLMKQIDELKNFLDSILRWSKNQSHHSPQPEYLNLFSVTEEAISVYDLAIRDKQIQFHLEVPKEIMVYADADMVKTVIRNLISNAIKFVKETDKVFVSARYRKGETVMVVRDTGAGISPEKIDHLFDLIHLSTSGTKGELGTGLGLSICREFIEKMNGKIFVTSIEGEGTTFEFTLPQRPSMTAV